MFPSQNDAMSAGLEAFTGAASQGLILAGLITLGLIALSQGIKALRRGRRSRRSTDQAPRGKSRLERAVEQVRTVEDSGFERKPLLNREEARVLPVLERAAREAGRGYRVMAQTSLGELIRPTDRDDWEAQAAINSKRLDFALIDRWGMLVCALEYQGTGHYQEGAAFRDTVKREALRKAGVKMLEVHPDFDADDLVRNVKAVIGARLAS